jgi:CDP-glycerol glycerophosphotransferase
LLIPRNEEIWIFGAWFGQRYSDNSKALFEYVLENSDTIKPYWVTKNNQVYEQLKKEGKPCLMCNSFKSIILTLKAGKVIFSSGKADVNYYFINGATTIQSWHGSPMKKIGLDSKNTNTLFRNRIIKYLFPFLWDYNFSRCVSTGIIFNNYLSSAFDIDKTRILTTGYPRNDIFFNRKKISPLIKEWDRKFNNPKKIIYLPTFRDHNPDCDLFKKFNFNVESWNKFLFTHNIILITKGHFASKPHISSDVNNRIIQLLDHETTDINLIMKDIDLLITDYSGAYFDFLLTNKPIILAPFDYDSYISNSRELYFNYYADFPNSKAQDWDEILSLLSKNNYRKDIKPNFDFNKYHDGDSCIRLFNSIANLNKDS